MAENARPHASPKRGMSWTLGRTRGHRGSSCEATLRRHGSAQQRCVEPMAKGRHAQACSRAGRWFVRQNASMHGLLHSKAPLPPHSATCRHEESRSSGPTHRSWAVVQFSEHNNAGLANLVGFIVTHGHSVTHRRWPTTNPTTSATRSQRDNPLMAWKLSSGFFRRITGLPMFVTVAAAVPDPSITCSCLAGSPRRR